MDGYRYKRQGHCPRWYPVGYVDFICLGTFYFKSFLEIVIIGYKGVQGVKKN